MRVGYARCAVAPGDQAAQLDALTAMGVQPERVYVDQGLVGTSRPRPGLGQALAACRTGDTLVVTALARLAYSVSDACDILINLARGGVGLDVGGHLYDLTDPVRPVLVDVLALIRGLESDLIRGRTREGMQTAKAKGRLRGKPPKLNAAQHAEVLRLWDAGTHTGAEIAELFNVARSTVYRAVQRAGHPDDRQTRPRGT